MLKNKRILLTTLMVFLMLLIPTIVKAETQIISKIDVTVPKPIIGETPAVASEISVIANDNISFEVTDVIWYIWDYTSNNYKEIEDLSQTFLQGKEYAIGIGYKRPNIYVPLNNEGFISDEFDLKLNGIKLNATDGRIFNVGSSGGIDYENDFIFHEFGYPDVEKNISTIDITIPKPEIGKKQYGIEDIIVKADKNEKLEVLTVEWYKYNSETKKYELDTVIASDEIIGFYDPASDECKVKEFEAGKKYAVHIMYSRPHKYGYSSSLVVNVNGEAIDVNNIERFNPGSWGDLEGDWDLASYEFEQLKEVIVENDKEDLKEEQTKDETAAPGKIPYTGGTFVLIVGSILLIVLGVYAFYKINI